MKIIEKIIKKQTERAWANSITIVCFGDSVTEGCFECYINEEGRIATVFERNQSYSVRLQELLSKLYPKVQFNVINSGLSGASLWNIEELVDRDVLAFNPDLVVVSYGLNDSQKALEGIAEYEQRLTALFEKIKASGAEIIFLTENYMCTNVSPHINEKTLKDLAKQLCDRQNTGIMDAYFNKAKEVSKKHGVTVCDLYSVWKAMDRSGVNVTELLSNKLNHPIREYHYYIALKLLEKMMDV